MGTGNGESSKAGAGIGSAGGVGGSGWAGSPGAPPGLTTGGGGASSSPATEVGETSYSPARGEQVISFGNVRIYLAEARAVRTDGPQERDAQLTALEYRLLLTFARHRGQVLSRSQLLESIWDVAGDFVGDNTVSVYIKRLREKLEEDPRNPRLIQTVRGFGYRAAAR